MTYVHWNTGELRRLRQMHEGAYPSMAEMAEAFAPHPINSIYNVAKRLGLRRAGGNQVLRWMLINHTHFARREAGLLA